MVTGLPIAWLLGRRRFPGHGLLETVVVLPLVLPPTVLGYYLLVLIGRTSWLGTWLARNGISLEFTWRVAVLAAWISAFGLFVRAAQPGFEQVDRSLEDAARTMGPAPNGASSGRSPCRWPGGRCWRRRYLPSVAPSANSASR